MSQDVQKVRRIVFDLVEIAHEEILSYLTQSKDPLVKLIALRKFKYGYGLPSGVSKYSREFKALGDLYARKKKDYDKIRVFYEQDRKLITRYQEAEINTLVVEAMKWAHTYWSAIFMARLLVRVGDEQKIISIRKELALFPKKRLDPPYANLIEILFEE
jgi:hypothetical protein